MGTPVPRPLLTVVASELDGDAITYAIDPPSVSLLDFLFQLKSLSDVRRHRLVCNSALLFHRLSSPSMPALVMLYKLPCSIMKVVPYTL